MTLAGYERAGLEEALDALNRARGKEPGTRDRLEESIRGLEALLAAETAVADRDRDGAYRCFTPAFDLPASFPEDPLPDRNYQAGFLGNRYEFIR